MSQLVAFLIIVLFLVIGEMISTATKAWIPSVFITAILFLVGYWTILPKDIVEIAGFSSGIVNLSIYMLIVNMGTLLSLEELKNQWRTICVSLIGITGIVASLMTIGVWLFDKPTMLTATPPLVGGILSAVMMSDAAAAHGYESLAVLAIAIYVLQGFAGYPLTSIMLKKEAKATLTKIRAGEWKEKLPEESDLEIEEGEKRTAPKMWRWLPDKYDSSFLKFFRVGIVAWVAYQVSVWLEPIVTISPMVLALIFGVVAASIGFIESQPMQKANGFGFCILILMGFIFDGLSSATPAMLKELILPIIGTVVIGVLGMYILSALTSRWFGMSKELAFSVSLTALYGFPADYIITKEIIDSSTEDEGERELLTNHMLPPMLVGGFISVTIVSVVLAGIFVTLY